jgi:hypothetical protein
MKYVIIILALFAAACGSDGSDRAVAEAAWDTTPDKAAACLVAGMSGEKVIVEQLVDGGQSLGVAKEMWNILEEECAGYASNREEQG